MQRFLGSWLMSLWLKLPFPELYSLRHLVHTIDLVWTICQTSLFLQNPVILFLLCDSPFYNPLFSFGGQRQMITPDLYVLPERAAQLQKPAEKSEEKFKKYWFSFLGAANSIELSHLSAAIKASSLLPGNISGCSSSNVRLLQPRYVKL